MAANDEYQRLLVRHATDLEGFEDNLVVSLILFLRRAERDLIAQLMIEMEALDFGSGTLTTARARRLEKVLGRIKDLRRNSWREYNKFLRSELLDFSSQEIEFAQQAFERAVQIEGIGLTAPEAATLRAALFARPFRLNENSVGTLAQFMAGIREQDLNRIEQAIRLGFVEGQSLDDIVRRIRGTREANFTDGILQISRRHAETIARTAFNHFANASKVALWEENSDVILGLVWTSVLDGRTTLICQSRDGHVAPIGTNEIPSSVKLPRLNPPNARPPAHANCRSIMVPLISPEGLIGTRPFVVDTRTGRKRTFRSHEDRLRWAVRRVGRVPAQVNYEQFIRSEDFDFMVEVYGPTKARLLRDGGLSIEDLVDRTGRKYTLGELRRRNAEAFRQAGLS